MASRILAVILLISLIALSGVDAVAQMLAPGHASRNGEVVHTPCAHDGAAQTDT